MKMEERKEILIEVLNKFFKESDIRYDEFNQFVELDNPDIIDDLNTEYDLNMILAYKDEIYGITPIQLIQNISEILLGQRLSFVIDEYKRITGVQWYNGYDFDDDETDDEQYNEDDEEYED